MKKIVNLVFRTIIVLFILLNIMAAFHAYKFTHFYPAATIQVKRPEDFTIWDKTKFILFGVDHPKSINQDSPDTTYQTIKITTIDSIHLEAWYINHSIAISKGTVIMFHGHGGCKAGIMGEGKAFLNMGYNVLLVDFRAHGGSSGNTCTIGMNESKDVKAAYDYIVSKGEKNILLWGISLGAASIAHSIYEFSLAPKKIILEMPFGSLVDAVEGRVRIMGLPIEPTGALLTFWGGIEQGFWGFGMKPSEYVKKINCPVLLQWGKNDQRVTRKEIDLIYNNISTTKKLVVYNYSEHESLCTNENEKWRNEVKNFLQQ